MGKQIFIPLTDDILYDHPELIRGPVLPYTTEKPCYHWLSVEINPPEIDFASPHRAEPAQRNDAAQSSSGGRARMKSKEVPQYREWLATLRPSSHQSLAR